MEDMAFADYDYEFAQDEEGEDYLDYYDEDVYELPVGESWEEEEEETNMSTGASMSELYEYCVVPTVSDSSQHLYSLLAWSLIFLLTTRIVRPPAWLVHLMSATCGGIVTWGMFGHRCSYMVCLLAVGGLVLSLSHFVLKSRRGPFTCVSCVAFLIACELWLADPVDWHSIRGPQMIILMKVVSVGFDLDSSSLSRLPNILEMVGYILNPGTVIFGPWISFSSYKRVLQPFSWNLRLVLGVIIHLITCMIFLLLSTCFALWMVPDSINKWAQAFRDAFSFRSSHYFVSYLSVTSAQLSGLDIREVARPAYIEIPRSLVEVVVYWNMPMHYWLKTYIFKTARNWFGIFWAILFTYSMSSLFHGLNFQLAAVLLSLGFYTYVEHSLRVKLASIFDACVLARPCPEKCHHQYKKWSWIGIFINISFSVLAMVHLAYLGIMFDSNSQEQETGYSLSHTLSKWASLSYSSHWIIFVCYIMYILI
ncbi:protein-serine O-palmitoleoyltransferase porcupine-like isoform X4 [Scylla paramamosain]